MKIKHIFTVIGFGLLKAVPVKAVCPVCVVAVGAGLGLSQYLGIDDTIAGTWIGGMLVAVSTWTIDLFNKKNWISRFKNIRNVLIFVAYYAMVIWPLYNQGLIGSGNTLFGIDKLLLGIIAGSLVFAFAVWLYEFMKKNNGKPHFPFEKVVLPISSLAALTLIFYLLT
ncbi:hypothetical protein CVU83_02570 [Candidatus Falkowbacteria bacterium HGW-Falkowbacteria-2]|uniref:Uncharacterized protein n=1 Tax=Candidatus Falkowbacteria bacterium HGW-Falkowbacteria-2 TaxID=2013769 RepID=A0A2N2DZA2_9BACT|nr:MAG: hypothetical protein CVU83_02570 [Candidatus Falkowbacteria bacterium HGW-Falkowbacteria-2]